MFDRDIKKEALSFRSTVLSKGERSGGNTVPLYSLHEYKLDTNNSLSFLTLSSIRDILLAQAQAGARTRLAAVFVMREDLPEAAKAGCYDHLVPLVSAQQNTGIKLVQFSSRCFPGEHISLENSVFAITVRLSRWTVFHLLTDHRLTPSGRIPGCRAC